jgi:hypothetical protein
MTAPNNLEPLVSPETQLDSFVVRFVYDETQGDADGANWHGLVRHVQSNAEHHFTRWEEAVAFIARYVRL